MTVTSQPEYIKFFCDAGDLYKQELEFGTKPEDE